MTNGAADGVAPRTRGNGMEAREIVNMGCERGTTPLPGRKIEYVVIHYTEWSSSRPGTAREVAEFFSMHRREASADFAVDDEELVAYNPDFRDRYCHTVGDGTTRATEFGARLLGVAVNRNCVSIEMCSTNSTGVMEQPNSENYFLTDATRSNALVMTRWLMDELGIDIDHVIRHFDTSGKLCPGIIGWNEVSGSTAEWERFRADLERQEHVDLRIGSDVVRARTRDEMDMTESDDPLVQAVKDMDNNFVRA